LEECLFLQLVAAAAAAAEALNNKEEKISKRFLMRN